MVNDVGSLAAVEPGNFDNRSNAAGEAVATPAPAYRAQRETLLADLFSMFADAGCDNHFETGLARSSGDW